MRTGHHTFLKMMDNSKHFVREVEVFNDNEVLFSIDGCIAVIQKTVKLIYVNFNFKIYSSHSASVMLKHFLSSYELFHSLCQVFLLFVL